MQETTTELGITKEQALQMNINLIRKFRGVDIPFTNLQRVALAVCSSKRRATPGTSLVSDALLEELREAAMPIEIQQ